MVKIQKISGNQNLCLGFTEFDMLKKYRQSFATSELGRLHSTIPLLGTGPTNAFEVLSFWA